MKNGEEACSGCVRPELCGAGCESELTFGLDDIRRERTEKRHRVWARRTGSYVTRGGGVNSRPGP